MEEENNVKEENVMVNNSNNSNKKNVFITVLVVFVIALIGIIIYLTLIKDDGKVADNNNSNNQQQNNTETNNQENSGQSTTTEPKYENNLTSDEDGAYGTVYLEGYAKVTKEADCGGDECQGDEPMIDVVSFYVTSPKVDGIDEWFVKDENGENGYIQLGCLRDGIVSFIAFADDFYVKRRDNIGSSENYYKIIELSKNDSDKIISSNENNHITLKIENKKWSYGSGGFTCASRITGAEVVK